LAAAHIGLNLPDRFGRVLSQSGAFAWSPEGDPEAEWLARQAAREPRLPLRVYQDVGSLEGDAPPDGGPSHLLANRHFRTVLQAKGYPVHYAEYSGGHDFLNLRGTLADGLIALFQDAVQPP
jgi:enterochelin esterase family protein